MVPIQRIDETLLNLAWSSWDTLGVAGVAPPEPDCYIDLEALILLTAVLSPSDPRLRDEALDWCTRHHHYVSISRLRTLVETIGEAVYLPFSAFAETLNALSSAKWPLFAKTERFHTKLSGKSAPPDCSLPALLGLRMRALFGLGARADLATFFLTQKPSSFSAADTVDIGYTKRTLADALDNFVQSGLLTSSVRRNQKIYDLTRNDSLTRLAGTLPRIIPDWRNLLAVFIPLRQIFSKPHPTSSQVLALCNAFENSSLNKWGFVPPPVPSNPSDWDAFLQTFVKQLCEKMRFSLLPKTDPSQPFMDYMPYLYSVADCLDGLEMLLRCSLENPVQHQTIFKEGYQMYACFLEELRSRLGDLLKFPVQRFNDFFFLESILNYTKEHFQSFVDFVKQAPSSREIAFPAMALEQYKKSIIEFDKIHRLLNEIESRLKALHFKETNINLLTKSTELSKRHAVLKLFSTNSEGP